MLLAAAILDWLGMLDKFDVLLVVLVEERGDEVVLGGTAKNSFKNMF